MTNPADPAPGVAAEALSGRTLDGDWLVGERIPAVPGATGGTFSVSYRVTDGSGIPAFLKALDYSRALQMPNTVNALQILINAYVYERDLVIRCADAKLSHVVKALAHGEVSVPGYAPLDKVNYLIFEAGDGDVRRHIDLATTFDLAWRLRALHHIALGLQQLHGQGIVHRDVKPSNIVVVDGHTAKVADLGRAAQHGFHDPYAETAYAGDPTYAPIETLYGMRIADARVCGRSCDLYHLGSMTLFLFACASTTPAVEAVLDPIYRWGTWGGPYAEVLPYLRSAFTQVCDDLRMVTPVAIADAVVRLFRELCDPDPVMRGNPKQAESTLVRLNVQRYVSAFDLLARRLEIDMKMKL